MLGRNLRLALFACAAVLLAAGAAPWAHAAETVHMYAKDGQGDIKGESTQSSLGRAGSIECVELEFAVGLPMASREGARAESGRLVMQPIRIVKRIDAASPRLLAAMASGRGLAGCSFRFFRPSPAGDGTTQQFYTVTLTGARIVSFRQYVPSTISPASSTTPPLEEVLIAYTSAECVVTDGGVRTQIGMSRAAPGKPESGPARGISQTAAAPKRPATRVARTASR